MPEYRGGFDIVYDKIKEALETYATAQAIVDPSYNFTVYQDYYRWQIPQTAGAYVYMYMGSLTPDGKGAAYGHYEYTAQYILDLLALAAGSASPSTYTRADAAAGSRLRYLIQQTMQTLYGASNIFLDQSIGTIKNRPMLRVEPLQLDGQQTEKIIAAARLTMEVSYAFEPTDQTEGIILQSVFVDADRFTALFEQEAY